MVSSDQILNDLKKKLYAPVYFLMGEEPYYIDLISDYIENNVLDESEKGFNQTVVYGRDVDTQTIISHAKRYPMMSNYQVVIIKEAQNISKIENLQSYFEKPLKSTLLVFCYKYKSLDKKRTIYKYLDKHHVVMESKKLYDKEIPGWIDKYIKSLNYTADPKAIMLMSDFLGNDLSKIVNEISKLIINIPQGTKITPDHIEQNIGISKDFNVFELQNAIGRRDVLKANQIINYFAANPKDNPIIVTLTILFGFFNKLLIYHSLQDKSQPNVASALGISPSFVKDYAQYATFYPIGKVANVIHLIKEFDLKAKGINNTSVQDGALLKELVFMILH